ncbi:MAG: glycosyltransferase [Lentisphaerae bacterium]|nr:glycosyltransferase [Lentisphaerota bacterium]
MAIAVQRGRRVATWGRFCVAAAILLLLCWQTAALNRPEHGSPLSFLRRAPGLSVLPGWRDVLLFSLMWFTALALLLLHPRNLRFRWTAATVMILAVAARLAMAPHSPSDDVNRYLWEGRLVREHINPYALAPDDPSLAHLAADDPYHASVNHADLPAAYPPLVQFIFAGLGAASYRPAILKLFLVLCDLGTLWLLLLLLRARALDPRWALLYAVNPVVLYSFAGHAHFDSLHNLFLLAALVLYDRRRWGLMFACAGLAVQSKYIAVLAVPFLIRRDNWRHAWWMAVAALAPYVPFLAMGGGGLLDCVVRFGGEFAFNGPLHAPLMVLLGSMDRATLVCKVLLVGVLLVGYRLLHPEWNPRHADDPVSGCYFALGALCILSPTVHFWYLTWIIPFLVLRPTLSWFVATLSISASFAAVDVMRYTGTWSLPVAAHILAWLPFWAILGCEGWALLFRARSRSPLPTGRTVSVVVPALNEEALVGSCVNAALVDPVVQEVIVVDGGSTDNTSAVATEAGARVFRYAARPERGGGRGSQIRAGVNLARGDIVAVVHADTVVPAPEFSRMADVLERQPMVIGGTLGSVFEGSGWRHRLLESANDLRMILFGVGFGDQVQFFRRKSITDEDLFPALPLMEDVELSLRLGARGRQVFMFGTASVSSRNWGRKGDGRRILMILGLCLRYLWRRRRGTVDTADLYRKYYGQSERTGTTG